MRSLKSFTAPEDSREGFLLVAEWVRGYSKKGPRATLLKCTMSSISTSSTSLISGLGSEDTVSLGEACEPSGRLEDSSVFRSLFPGLVIWTSISQIELTDGQ
jgi:hypothetical protein